MKSCRNCKDRDVCVRLCTEVEGRLPKDGTGKDAHIEVSMSPEGFGAAVERHAFCHWHFCEAAYGKFSLDLSRLTAKERRAVMLLASGLSQREVAARLKISRGALRSRMDSARAKIYPAQFSHLIERGER